MTYIPWHSYFEFSIRRSLVNC